MSNTPYIYSFPFFFLVPAIACAFDNPLESFVTQEMVRSFVMAVIYVGVPAVVVGIVWVGFLFTAAQGNSDMLGKAKHMAILVFAAGVILLSLWAIVSLVGNTLAGFSSAALLIVIVAFLLYVYFKA